MLVVVEDRGVVEAEGLGEGIEVEVSRFFGVVGAQGLALSVGNEDNRDGMQPPIARGIRVDIEEFFEHDVQAGFLFGFADGGSFDMLSLVDKTAGNGPAMGWVPAFDEYDLVIAKNEDIGGGSGVSVFWHGFTLLRCR